MLVRSERVASHGAVDTAIYPGVQCKSNCRI
jgi:hypothetical protein